MNNKSASVTEEKKSFSRLIQDVYKKKDEIIVTRRGKPVAVIIPYEEYKRSKRVEDYMNIMKAREAFLKAGILADAVSEESRKQLEKGVE